MSLNDLFMQILESEQKARERKSLLNEIKTKVSAVRQQLKATQTEADTLLAQVAVKVQELSTEELECQWVSKREGILQEQLADQMKEKQTYSEQLHLMKSSRENMKEEFLSSISTFIHDYGLTSRGKDERLASIKEQIISMRARQDKLQADIDSCNKQKNMLRCIDDEKKSTEEMIATLKSEINGLEDTMVSEKIKTKELEGKKALVAGKPHSDPEFKRLQTQLDACRQESLEGLCQTLQQQIDQLQRQQWQQQLRRQHPASSGRPQPRFKWTAQPSASRVQQPPSSSMSSSFSTSASLQCLPRKTPPITAPDLETMITSSSSPASTGKPNLARLSTALKCKVDEN